MEPEADGDRAGQALRKRFACPKISGARKPDRDRVSAIAGSLEMNRQGGVSVIEQFHPFGGQKFGKLNIPDFPAADALERDEQPSVFPAYHARQGSALRASTMALRA
ncbi:hypothetical protein ASA1KI_22840 [Opitutales bacterium ASA1]|uniref:hypothetical protein n=1 Tax=Congregicoccus parvus TaxID=3081749 RepID=UPI002B2BF54D|nr:hypothetical protein ASA1KI_22840 [Opitutales bacterium ASA1]